VCTTETRDGGYWEKKDSRCLRNLFWARFGRIPEKNAIQGFAHAIKIIIERIRVRIRRHRRVRMHQLLLHGFDGCAAFSRHRVFEM
jgi:hypothetical protein